MFGGGGAVSNALFWNSTPTPWKTPEYGTDLPRPSPIAPTDPKTHARRGTIILSFFFPRHQSDKHYFHITGNSYCTIIKILFEVCRAPRITDKPGGNIPDVVFSRAVKKKSTGGGGVRKQYRVPGTPDRQNREFTVVGSSKGIRTGKKW